MTTRTPKDPSAPKTRKAPSPKPLFIVTGGDCPVIGVYRKAEEVLKVLEDNPGSKYVKYMLGKVE